MPPPIPPYHVAGGAFAGKVSVPEPSGGPFATATPPAQGSRRRRLWEMAHKCHCPLVGVCFGVDELRGLMARVMHFPRATADFVLHTSAVGACETRGPLSELLHKTLEKRFQADIRRFASAKDSPAVARLWRASVAAGTGIPGALWAAWSHPACDKALEQEIYADIHMLQHQVGTGTRADLGALQALRDENARLRSELADARGEAESLRREKSRESALLGEQAAALRVELAGKEAAAANLAGQLDSLRQALPELRDRQALLRRAGDAESRATALTARVAELERELERRQRVCRPQETTVAAPPAEAAPAGAALEGKCVLCVGGRSGAVEAYRQLVESRGGRFLHHDGGLEESLHRIDAALAAADLVICQAGCISHNAYWRVKEQCKRSGKRCIYLKTAGVSTFARSVAEAGASTTAPPAPAAFPPGSPAGPLPR